MGLIHDEKIYGLKIRESADDGSDFSNPDADYRIAFVGEDGQWHLKDSSGTVTEPGGSGSVATDAIWDAAGDLAVGSGANTAVKLPMGSALQHLRVNAGATALEYADPPSGGSAESWETAVADLSGKVHRWKFDEASGDFADDISTLDLVANGTINYQASSPLGDAAEFAGGYAESSGLGSIPIGDAARCVLLVWKRNSVTGGSTVPLFSYGTTGTRTLWELYGDQIGRFQLTDVTTGLIVNAPFGDGQWHLTAGQHCGTGTALRSAYHDGDLTTGLANGNLATSSANNFHVAAEFDDSDPAAITVADCIVFDRWLAKWELDRLYAALRAALA